MSDYLKLNELGAARLTYHQQIKYGSGPDTALDFAVLGYLKQNRHVPVDEARARLADALGIEQAER
jgi:hypothetical protein